MSDRPSTLERIALAYDSTDLGMVSSDLCRIKDADVLVATGIAAQRTGLSASMLYLHSSRNVTAIKRAKEAIVDLARKLNAKRGWDLDEVSIVRVAETALVHHVSPACRHCGGLGYHVIALSPSLSDRKCSHCKGSGLHPISRRYRDQVKDVLCILARVDSLTEHHVRKLLR